MAIAGTRYRVTMKLTEPMLGTAPLNKDLYSEFIATRAAPDSDVSDELDTLPEALEKGTTGFHRVDGAPVLKDYMIKGFLKEATGALKKVPGSKAAKLTAYKKAIDGHAFVFPRNIAIDMHGGAVGILERPLRASTPQGERVALARSEMVPEGSTFEFDLLLLEPGLEPIVRECFEYAALRGLGQWRNASWGRCDVEMTEIVPQ